MKIDYKCVHNGLYVCISEKGKVVYNFFMISLCGKCKNLKLAEECEVYAKHRTRVVLPGTENGFLDEGECYRMQLSELEYFLGLNRNLAHRLKVKLLG